MITSPSSPRNVTKSKVVRVGSLMKPLPKQAPEGGFSGEVSAGAAVADAAPLFAGNGMAIRVVDTDGAAIGCLMRDDVVRIMMQA